MTDAQAGTLMIEWAMANCDAGKIPAIHVAIAAMVINGSPKEEDGLIPRTPSHGRQRQLSRHGGGVRRFHGPDRSGEMTDLPIPFTAAMVRAIVREIERPGTGKTETRRITNAPEWSRSSG